MFKVKLQCNIKGMNASPKLNEMMINNSSVSEVTSWIDGWRKNKDDIDRKNM